MLLAFFQAIAFLILLVFCRPLSPQERGGPNQNDLLGTVLPNLDLSDAATNTLTLDSLMNGNRSLLLLLPLPAIEADCKARQNLVDGLRAGLSAMEVSVIPMLPRAAQQGRNTCGSDAKVYFRGDPSQRSIRMAGLGGLFLDGDRTVRRVFPGDMGADDAERIIEEVRLWLDGKEWFQSQCARCHGDDGKDEGYPGTKSLARIGNRHSEREIIELTELAGFVDLHSMNSRARRALGIFVAGL